MSKSVEGEEAGQHEIAVHFRRLGRQVEIIASIANRLSLAGDFAVPADVPEAEQVSVVAVQAGVSDGRSLFVFAHPEGEPMADTELWQHDPFGS